MASGVDEYDNMSPRVMDVPRRQAGGSDARCVSECLHDFFKVELAVKRCACNSELMLR